MAPNTATIPISVNRQNPAKRTNGLGTTRCLSKDDHVSVLTNIYSEKHNIAIWQRDLSPALRDSVKALLDSNPLFKTSMTVSPESALPSLTKLYDLAGYTELCQDVARLVDMFCLLFDINYTGLRLTALHKTMCPKFHVDHVPCRLLTTYQGVATEWLPHNLADRTKLGRGSNGLPDGESGLYQSHQDIQQLDCGDVALLKGEQWEGNEGAGLIHRSPTPATDERRLLLTLDFVS